MLVTVSFSHCCHSGNCRSFFAPLSHRTADICTLDLRTFVSFAFLARSHCWPSHIWLRTGVVRTFVFRTLVVQAYFQRKGQAWQTCNKSRILLRGCFFFFAYSNDVKIFRLIRNKAHHSSCRPQRQSFHRSLENAWTWAKENSKTEKIDPQDEVVNPRAFLCQRREERPPEHSSVRDGKKGLPSIPLSETGRKASRASRFHKNGYRLFLVKKCFSGPRQVERHVVQMYNTIYRALYLFSDSSTTADSQ